MKTKLTGLLLFGLTIAAVALYPAVHGADKQPAPTAGQAPRVEVVFVLDTTSSMTGLIETAKEKIWSIAATMAQAQQAPEIHMGLVAYRDRGDEYVTRVYDLTSDLDRMYATLMQFEAVGGGDGPESVNAALDAAVNRISWSQDPRSYQVVFLVGDAPPHMDYGGEPRYPELVRTAAARGIVVNTIQCGQVAATARFWTEIATLGRGRYMRVDEAGGAFARTTPYDAEIAKLSAELDRTRLFYGSEPERAARHEQVAAATAARADISTEAQARRGVFNATAAGSASLFGDRDLVAAIGGGRVVLDEIAPADLPAPLAALEESEREAAVADLAEQRADLQRRIRTLADARAALISREAAASPAAQESLERQIYDAIREQGAAKGLKYERGPEY